MSKDRYAWMVLSCGRATRRFASLIPGCGVVRRVPAEGPTRTRPARAGRLRFHQVAQVVVLASADLARHGVGTNRIGLALDDHAPEVAEDEGTLSGVAGGGADHDLARAREV